MALEQAWSILKNDEPKARDSDGELPYFSDENANAVPWGEDWHSVPCETCGAEMDAPCTEMEGDPPRIMTKTRGLIEDPLAFIHPEQGVHARRMFAAARQPGWARESPVSFKRKTPNGGEE